MAWFGIDNKQAATIQETLEEALSTKRVTESHAMSTPLSPEAPSTQPAIAVTRGTASQFN
jgi:hypothetical protein